MVDAGPSGIEDEPRIVAGLSHDHIVITVTVDVARGGDRVADHPILGGSLHRPMRDRGDAGGRRRRERDREQHTQGHDRHEANDE